MERPSFVNDNGTIRFRRYRAICGSRNFDNVLPIVEKNISEITAEPESVDKKEERKINELSCTNKIT